MNSFWERGYGEGFEKPKEKKRKEKKEKKSAKCQAKGFIFQPTSAGFPEKQKKIPKLERTPAISVCMYNIMAPQGEKTHQMRKGL